MELWLGKERKMQQVDFFATKGLEYLIVIAFLVASLFFWRFLVVKK